MHVVAGSEEVVVQVEVTERIEAEAAKHNPVMGKQAFRNGKRPDVFPFMAQEIKAFIFIFAPERILDGAVPEKICVDRSRNRSFVPDVGFRIPHTPGAVE